MLPFNLPQSTEGSLGKRVANGLGGELEGNGASIVLDAQVPRAKDSAFPHDQQVYEPDAEPSGREMFLPFPRMNRRSRQTAVVMLGKSQSVRGPVGS